MLVDDGKYKESGMPRGKAYPKHFFLHHHHLLLQDLGLGISPYHKMPFLSIKFYTVPELC
jgi:hypothetical protein